MHTYMHARKKTSFRLKYHLFVNIFDFWLILASLGRFWCLSGISYHLETFSRLKLPKIVEWNADTEMRHRFTTTAQPNNMKIQILEFIKSFGCKDIKNSPNNKITGDFSRKFFFKKRKGVCTKQFCGSPDPVPFFTEEAKNGRTRLNKGILITNEH